MNIRQFISFPVVVVFIALLALPLVAGGGGEIRKVKCPASPTEVVSDAVSISNDGSHQLQTLDTGSWGEAVNKIKGYIKGGCAVRIALTADSDISYYECKKAGTRFGNTFQCRYGSAEKEVAADVFALSRKDEGLVVDPVLEIGPTIGDYIYLNTRASFEDGTQAMFTPSVFVNNDGQRGTIQVFVTR